MKIAFHSYQLGDRGTEICLYKYAKYNQEILGNESVIISTSSRPTPTLGRFEDEFKTILYPDVWQDSGHNPDLKNTLEKIVSEEKIDAFYAIKGGEDDDFMPENCKRLAHCIFRMDQPHGDVYAGVCKYISDKHGGTHPYVYHIIEKECPDEKSDLRSELNIPSDAVVLGRHGGGDTFNLNFTYKPISQALEENKKLHFLFLNTNKFYEHERITYLPWTMDAQKKSQFINTCDAMIHARLDGEIFSLATAEFAVRNKPIITWDGYESYYDRGHIEIFKDKAFYYKNAEELLDLLKNLTPDKFKNQDWNVYKETYSPRAVMNQFNDVFLK